MVKVNKKVRNTQPQTFESQDTAKNSNERISWSQLVIGASEGRLLKKKSVGVLLLEKYDYKVDFRNVHLLRAFLSDYGKIYSRTETGVTVQQQRVIAKAIRHARSLGIIPFTTA